MVPATIAEENGDATYVRGPSLMHLLQPQGQAVEEGEREDTNSAPPLSLLHLLQPPSDTGPPPLLSLLPLTSSSLPIPTDPPRTNAIPKLLFLRQSSTDASHTVVTQVPLIIDDGLATDQAGHATPNLPYFTPATFPSPTSHPPATPFPLPLSTLPIFHPTPPHT